MAHRDAIGHRDGAKLTGCAACGSHTLLDGLSLAHQCDIAGSSLIPAGGNADERLVDLLGRQSHGVEIRPMRSALRPLRHVTARQSLLEVGLGVHRVPAFRPMLSSIGNQILRKRIFLMPYASTIDRELYAQTI